MRSSRRRRRRSHKLLAAGIAILLLFGLASGDLAYAVVNGAGDQLQAALTADLQAGQRELEAGKTSLTQANAKHDTTLVTEAISHFSAAKAQFQAAAQLADSSRLLHGLEQLPSVGDVVRSRHAAVDGIAAMGSALSDAGQDVSDLDAQLIKPASAGPSGRTLLTVLDETNAGLAKVRGDLKRAQLAAAPVQVNVLPASQQATFLKARETIDSGLAGLAEFETLVPVLRQVLGANGTRTFLVEQVNPAELRPGGGFIGTYSVVQAANGAMTVIRSGDAYDLAEPRPLPGQPGFVPEPDPLRDVIPTISWSFVDSNVFPDFPSNARAALRFAEPRLGLSVDAVISMDYYTVAKMLELTGPLKVPGYGTTVDAGNFIPLIIQLDLTGDPAHKAILSAIAGPLMQRVSALPADRWPALMGALNDLAAARHLQVYFKDEVAEKEISKVGWSGDLIRSDTFDFMMEVESNIGGGKANYFIDRNYSVTLTLTGSVLHHAVTIDFVNRQPNPDAPFPHYVAYAGLYVNGDASSASSNLRLAKYPKPTPPSGMTLLEGWQPDISCCGGLGTTVFQYDTPWPSHDRGVDRIYWQKQPGTVIDNVDVTWNDGRGNTYHVSGNLAQDRVITLSPNGVTLTPGQPAQAKLPSLSLG